MPSTVLTLQRCSDRSEWNRMQAAAAGGPDAKVRRMWSTALPGLPLLGNCYWSPCVDCDSNCGFLAVAFGEELRLDLHGPDGQNRILASGGRY